MGSRPRALTAQPHSYALEGVLAASRCLISKRLMLPTPAPANARNALRQRWFAAAFCLLASWYWEQYITRTAEAASNCRRVHQDGRQQPQYRGLSGYVAQRQYAPEAWAHKRLPPVPWRVPVLEQVGPSRWEPGRTRVPAKTPVVVLSQSLTHEGFGRYTGLLRVRTQTLPSTELVIDVDNFTESAYWTCAPHEAARVGPFIARVAPGKLGVSRDGRWEPLGKERRVYCKGIGTRRDVAQPVSCMMYKTFRHGYGGVEFEFASADLTIEY